MGHALSAFLETDLVAAGHVEPLEQVIDLLKEQLRMNHIRRLQQGACSIHAGFVWSDILTDLERVSDHCSNIAIYLMQKLTVNRSFDRKVYQDELHKGVDPRYRRYIDKYKREYLDRIRCVGEEGFEEKARA